ncbi:EFR1 family ferrodoxin [Thermodesulfobacteriota bacterium]
MKSIVVYFSLTGNTKKIAKAIHRGMSRLSDQCDISSVCDVDTRNLRDYDLVGFGAPVWGGPPPNVTNLINAMPSLEGKHTFAFCTHGALPDRFFSPIVELLQKKGSTVIGLGDWYGSVYLPSLPKPYLTDGHPDETDIKEAEEFGRKMVELSKKISAEGPQLIPALQLMPMIPRSNLPRSLPKLSVQKCRYPQCRLCEDNCPMDAINLSGTPPGITKDCCTCHFCEMICPEGAMEVDYEILAKASSKRAKDKFIKALEKAEAEGRFRRLVPLDEVGWDTPYYKVYNKHPRYIIPDENSG